MRNIVLLLVLLGGCGPGSTTQPAPESLCVDRVFSSTYFDTHCYRSEQTLESLPERGANNAAMFACRCPRATK